ncbi:MAG: AAA family ATPase [Gammaproteobacteria bacterium]|nr:AAA family ATPase [Gammaproteobacteria bacterium]MDD9961397.1 AAA family ATPase [Gammaproteobacteria bacterium]MDE0271376.1 AAA family ATPase [Gammaproteobacteria bacterium]
MVAKESLELEVANFGPIVNGRIGLRPLTVFVGPSNTGKSYLAILIYALHRFFASGLSRGMRDRVHLGLDGDVPKVTFETISAWADEVLGGRDESLGKPTESPLTLPPAVAQTIQSLFDEQADALAEEIIRCFGTTELHDLVRKGRSVKAGVTVRKLSDDDRSLRFEHKLSLKPLKLGSVFADELRLAPQDGRSYRHFFWELERSGQYSGARRTPPYWYVRFFDSLIDLLLPEIVGALHRRAYYLPADRTGVMHSHNVVVSTLIERAAMAGLRQPPKTPTLSGVLADFLEQLIGMDSHPHPHRKSSTALAQQIESAVLQGAVRMETGEATGYPRFAYRPEGWKDSLPLMNASSMVSELAPVVLFLRHLVAPGDLLIIEEPESHLHPAMQVEFTRQIASLVRSGIRVLVTTHSEWVLEELSNIVLASSVPKSRQKDAKGNGIALKKSDVGVWAFTPKQKPKGTIVEEINLSASGDLYSASFDDVSVETYNRWVRLGNLVGGDA